MIKTWNGGFGVFTTVSIYTLITSTSTSWKPHTYIPPPSPRKLKIALKAMWLFCTIFMIRDSTAWKSHKDKILCYNSVRSANQNKVNIFEKSFTVEYIWQNHVTSSSLQRIMALVEEDSIIKAPVSYTWNLLEPLSIRNICNITIYVRYCFSEM